MNTSKPTLKFQIDIVDYKNDEEIIDSIKKLLMLSKDQEFIDNVFLENGEKLSISVSPNISFVFSYCI
jgi:hypothetical protein